MSIYIFDIDGTLADLTHRLPLIQKVPKDWDAFFKACVDDCPIEPVCTLARDLAKQGATILMLSGRSNAVRSETVQWLRDYEIPCHGLYMRTVGDHRSDHIVKPELMGQLLAVWPRGQIVGIFDDRNSVVKAHRAMGFTVFQVADGNF